jgi:hypothetical protein
MTDRVFLVDVDNTLLDNDAVIRDLRDCLRSSVGNDGERRYFEMLEELRADLGYVDYFGALQRLRMERPVDLGILDVSLFLLRYPFADRVYPKALDVIAYLNTRAPVVILSDGDAVYQPRKVRQSGLSRAVDGRVLIYPHKEVMLDDVERRFPALRYVAVDDKLRLLAAIKKVWNERVTTVFVRQGHYANDPSQVTPHPAADVTVDAIGDLGTIF